MFRGGNHLHAQIGTSLPFRVHNNFVRSRSHVVSKALVLLHADFFYHIFNGGYIDLLFVVKQTVKPELEDHAWLTIQTVLCK